MVHVQRVNCDFILMMQQAEYIHVCLPLQFIGMVIRRLIPSAGGLDAKRNLRQRFLLPRLQIGGGFYFNS